MENTNSDVSACKVVVTLAKSKLSFPDSRELKWLVGIEKDVLE